MTQTILHKANSRGHADLGWLDSWHTFSFAGYYNPDRIRFGMLRVLNDDSVTGGRGFGSHPHDNMEIVSIPLEGSLVHQDNMGHTRIVSKGEIQVMSTGKGVFHSEYNNSPDEPAKFLQIWVFPNKLNVEPRYDQFSLDPSKGTNRLQLLISPAPANGNKTAAHNTPGASDTTDTAGGNTPDAGSGGTWIYQDAWFHMGCFDADKQVTYTLHKPGNGVYLFVIGGAFETEGQQLDARDGLGISGTETINLHSLQPDSQLLIMEVPMQ